MRANEPVPAGGGTEGMLIPFPAGGGNEHEPHFTLPEHDVRFRLHHKDYVEQFSDESRRDILSMLQNVWQEMARELFDGRMTIPPMFRLETLNARQICIYRPVGGNGSRGEACFPPSLLEGTHPCMLSGGTVTGKSRFVEDLLLKSMVQQYQHEILGVAEKSEHGYGPKFRDACNWVGEKIGLSPVRCKRDKNDLPLCSHWPFIVRPSGYYENSVDLNRLLGIPTGRGNGPNANDPRREQKRVSIYADSPVRENAKRMLRIFDLKALKEQGQAMIDLANELVDQA